MVNGILVLVALLTLDMRCRCCNSSGSVGLWLGHAQELVSTHCVSYNLLNKTVCDCFCPINTCTHTHICTHTHTHTHAHSYTHAHIHTLTHSHIHTRILTHMHTHKHTHTHTLSQREQELEIAAKLGQLLLKRNEILETDLSAALAVKETLTTTAAQLKHEVTKKEELLKLYCEDYAYEQNTEEGDFMPEWIHMLKNESRELRNDNYQLQYEVRMCVCVCVYTSTGKLNKNE